MVLSFRLISFNPYDRIIENEEDAAPPSNYAKANQKEFLVQMFGINELGETVCIFVEGYTPFFYVKVPDHWADSHRIDFMLKLEAALDTVHAACIVGSTLVKRKKLYGFDGGKEHNFILIRFKNVETMKKTANLWYNIQNQTSTTEYKKTLKSGGYVHDKQSTFLYEAQIPPMLRMFHIKEISPSGWISLPHKNTTKIKNKTTTCTYEFIIKYSHIIAQPQKETIVPYKICSFDIESSSSHGDFPLAVKNYKKLATNIVDLCTITGSYYDKTVLDKYASINCYLKEIILTAFNFNKNPIENVDRVYTKTAILLDKVESLFKSWIVICPEEYKGAIVINDNDIFTSAGEPDEEEGEDTDEAGTGDADTSEIDIDEPVFNWRSFKPKVSAYKKKGTISDLLADSDVSRDTQILELTRTLTNIFPPIKGDMVTFIGSTFIRHGEKKPYLNHCIALGTCNPVENAQIECYPTEKEVLLQWSNLIQKEDPDIVIGYNINGFDYQFMYLRAKENGCDKKFLKLSRNIKDVCLNHDWRTGKDGLEESSIRLASGQFDLKYIKMTGRLQIDLVNYMRREYTLPNNTLDYVSGHFICDYVSKFTYIDGNTKIHSKNLTGLDNGCFIKFKEEAHTTVFFKKGAKFKVYDVDISAGTFMIKGLEYPDIINKKIVWGLAKDDVTHHDIFRMTNEGDAERAIIAKYCIQDCNLVQHLLKKIDIITGYIEMANLTSVPMEFLVTRGQGIKATSFMAKNCRQKNTLMPVIDKGDEFEAYEGAIVLEPKCKLYADEPIATLDFASLYPTVEITDNISLDSKVYTREYDLNGKLLKEVGEKDETGRFIYDNLPTYTYIDRQFDTYKLRRKGGNPKAAMEKIKVGYKITRWAQFPDNVGLAILPSILVELLAARKATRKLIPVQTDEFMKNVLDKRQLSIKLVANSLYGQTGAKTSTFYDIDCAAATTAAGRQLIMYAKRVIDEAYINQIIPTKNHGNVRTNAESVYGDTDSVFFKFNLEDPVTGESIRGMKALEITIELAKEAGELASMFLRQPHNLEYEKTWMPLLLVSPKRYVGMKYEDDHLSCKLTSMGLVLKRRDNAPIVKDIYGAIIDILMLEQNLEKAIKFLRDALQALVDGKCDMNKLIISKSLRSGYKKPNQIAHKVLADRMGKRDTGNKPGNGDRIHYVFIDNPNRKALQGDCIETPEFITKNKLKINYAHYITNQIMNPVQQIFALVLENIKDFKKKKGHTLQAWYKELKELKKQYPDPDQYKDKEQSLRNKEVKALLFDDYIRKSANISKGAREITQFFN